MRKHTKVYMDHFGYGMQDFIPCELLGVRANDVHHIVCRGAGGTNREEDIDNLMALERTVHLLYGDKNQYMGFLQEAHRLFIVRQLPYVEINPHHPAFDALEGTAYEYRILHERRIIDDLIKNGL